MSNFMVCCSFGATNSVVVVACPKVTLWGRGPRPREATPGLRALPASRAGAKSSAQSAISSRRMDLQYRFRWAARNVACTAGAEVTVRKLRTGYYRVGGGQHKSNPKAAPDFPLRAMVELLRRRAPRVLVVEDNEDNRLLMKELLESRGYEVACAADADEAEIAIRSAPPDLILLDVVMPGRSGNELCRQLKDDLATRLIPVVMITGLTDREDRVRGIEAGADDVLNKPIFPEELFARVKSLIKLKEFTDELETAESILCTLGLSVESHDPYTEGHCERLAINASNLGRHIRLDEEEIVALRRGGYLHDLGKIAVPDEILKKGTNLTPQEWG